MRLQAFYFIILIVSSTEIACGLILLKEAVEISESGNIPIIDSAVFRKSIFEVFEPWKHDDIPKDLAYLPKFQKIIFEHSYLGNFKLLEDSLHFPICKNLVNSNDDKGRTPLHFACAFGHFDVVQLLLQNDANPSATDSTNGITPLICASVIGDEMIMKALLSWNADIDQGLDIIEEDETWTALHWAVRAGNLPATKYLLGCGARLTGTIIHRETPLHEAASIGNDEILKLLLQYGSKQVNLKGGSQHNAQHGTALHVAVQRGSKRCIEALLAAGAFPSIAKHCVNDKEQAPLHIATANADIDTTKLLLQNNGDPDMQDDFGRTPLHYCALNGLDRYNSDKLGKRRDPSHCLELLLEKSSDVNIQDELGYTAFHLAMMYDNSRVVAILLRHGADLTISIKSGQSGLEILMQKMPHAIRYVKESLDSAMSICDDDIADPNCTLILDFRAIVTTAERKVPKIPKFHRETEFLKSLCKTGQESILSHPLIEAFLYLKWQRVRKYFWASFLANLLLVLTYSWFAYSVYNGTCPVSSIISDNITHQACENDESESTVGSLTISLKIVWMLLIIMAMVFILKEILQLIESPKAYPRMLENYVQMFFLITMVVTMRPVLSPIWNNDRCICAHLSLTEYRFAAFGIPVAWLLVLLRIGRLPKFGLYVQMLFRVVINFGLFMVAYASILIAFSLSFSILINKSQFNSVFGSFQAVLVMMTGEVDIHDFESKSLPWVTQIMLIIFVLLVTIVLMNLLVGLAVSDIQGLHSGAKVARLSRLVVAISQLESILISKGLISILPKSWKEKIQRSALVIRWADKYEFYFRPYDPRDMRLPQSLQMEALEIVQRMASDKGKTLNQNHRNIATENDPRVCKQLQRIEKSLESLRSLERKVDEMYNTLSCLKNQNMNLKST